MANLTESLITGGGISSQIESSDKTVKPEETSASEKLQKKYKFRIIIFLILIIFILATVIGTFVYFNIYLSPEKITSKMFSNLDKIDNFNVETVAYLVNTQTYADTTYSVNYKLSLTGSVVSSELKSFDTALLGEMSLNNEQLVKADFLEKDTQYFFRLYSTPLLQFSEIDGIKDTWVKVDTDLTNLNLRKYKSNEILSLLKEILFKTSPFKIVERYPDKRSDGKVMYNFRINVNEERFFESVGLLAESVSDDPDSVLIFKENLKQILMHVDFSDGEIWIGKKDYYPYKLKIKVNFLDENSVITSTGELDFNLTDFNELSDIKLPEKFINMSEIRDLLSNQNLLIDEFKVLELLDNQN